MLAGIRLLATVCFTKEGGDRGHKKLVNVFVGFLSGIFSPDRDDF
jgi:hypothetical protein